VSASLRPAGFVLALVRAVLLAILLADAAPSSAAPAAGAAPALIEDTLAQRVAACTACHGKEGRAAPDGYHPRIAGKPADYLLHQLLNFRDGRRGYGPMAAIVQPLPEPYLREIAAHFAALDLPYPAPARTEAPPALLERGRRLALQGDTARELPACAACHGRALTGVLPATPGLLGLPRDYLAAQLGAWVGGQRRAHAPDCMAQVARRLSADDVAAVSTWLAAQPVPLPARAAAAPPAPLPLRCGSNELLLR
jgi:cytochrome c553